MSRPNERTVTLADGREVSSYSEEWRHEAECLWLLETKPTRSQKHLWLYGVHDRRQIINPNTGELAEDWKKTAEKSITHLRGLAAADQLLADARKIYELKKA